MPAVRMGGPAAGSQQPEVAAALTAIDTAASCPICHFLLDTPLLLRSCGHSYCSTCIRQNLAFQERSGPPNCPTCRKPCDARDLLPNATLREILDKYAAARPLLLAGAKESTQAVPGQGDSDGRQQGQAVRRWSGRKRMRMQQHKHEHEQLQLDREKIDQEAEVLPGRRRTRSASCGKVDTDLAERSSSGWSDDDASEPEVSSGEADDDGNSSPSPQSQRLPLSRHRQMPPAAYQQQQQQQQHAGQQAEGGPADTPSGFVRCPVCSKAVPAFFINSHVDLCLMGSSHLSKAAVVSGNISGRAGLEAAAPGAVEAPFEPLAVPPKLVPSLATEKSLRQLLRKYCMTTDGKKKELLDRYSKLRLAVELANDKQERTTYKQLAKRVAAQERQMAAVQLLQPASKPGSTANAPVPASRTRAAAAAAIEMCATAAVPWAVGRGVTPPAALQVDLDSMSDPAAIILTGCGYRELITVTRQRDAVRRRLRQQAAAQAATERVQQQGAGVHQRQFLGLDEAGGWSQQRAQLGQDDDDDAWGGGQPLSQHLRSGSEQQRRERQLGPVVAGTTEQQQKQHPPNSGGDLAAGGPCSRLLAAAVAVAAQDVEPA